MLQTWSRNFVTHTTVLTSGIVSQQYSTPCCVVIVCVFDHTQHGACYLQELEKQFPNPPLLPGSEEHRAEVQEVCQYASGVVAAYTAPACKACAQA